MFEIFEKIMKEKGLRYADVARGAGVHYSIITDWKAGRTTPKIDKLQRIADFFGVSVNYLMTGKQETVMDDPEFKFVADAWPMLTAGDKAEILALINIKIERYKAAKKASSVS